MKSKSSRVDNRFFLDLPIIVIDVSIIIQILSFHSPTLLGRILEISYCEVFNTLMKAFTSAFSFTYWISNAQLIVEIDISSYILTTILLIMIKDNKVHLVAFHF